MDEQIEVLVSSEKQLRKYRAIYTHRHTAYQWGALIDIATLSRSADDIGVNEAIEVSGTLLAFIRTASYRKTDRHT